MHDNSLLSGDSLAFMPSLFFPCAIAHGGTRFLFQAIYSLKASAPDEAPGRISAPGPFRFRAIRY